MPRRHLVVVGSYNRDTILEVPHLPAPGETLQAITASHAHGGKGSNQAVQAARAGGAVTFVASLGADEAAAEARGLWQAEGIAARAAEIPQAPTGLAVILLDAVGRNSIVVLSGANARLDASQAQDAAGAIQHAAVVLAQLETPAPATAQAFRLARAAGATTILNAAPANAAMAAALLPLSDILVVNEVEAAQLAPPGDATPRGLATRLAAAAQATVVLTAGAEGAFLARPGMPPIHLPAIPVAVRDSTGAGDAFCGAFAAGLAAGLPIEAAAARGIAAGSLACTVLGAVPSLHDAAAIDALLAKVPA